MRLDHPIFQGPRKVDLEWSEVDTPEDYSAWPDGRDVAKRTKVWRVQQGEFPKDVDCGLVSDPYGFEDSPDCEWISSGINSKGPNSMAIGRQANRFLWGFAGDASQMTESGRAVFVNAIVYMKSFEGATPLVQGDGGSAPQEAREWALMPASYLRAHADDESARQWVEQSLPDAVKKLTGIDAAKIDAYYRENFEYLRPAGSRQFAADEDCKRLGVGNRSREFLPKLIERWKSGSDEQLCRRLTARYVGAAQAKSIEALEAWYVDAGSRLYFSDRGGFRWLVAPNRWKTSVEALDSPKEPARH